MLRRLHLAVFGQVWKYREQLFGLESLVLVAGQHCVDAFFPVRNDAVCRRRGHSRGGCLWSEFHHRRRRGDGENFCCGGCLGDGGRRFARSGGCLLRRVGGIKRLAAKPAELPATEENDKQHDDCDEDARSDTHLDSSFAGAPPASRGFRMTMFPATGAAMQPSLHAGFLRSSAGTASSGR